MLAGVLDVGSTPTGSIYILHSFANLSKTLFLQRFFILFFGILLQKKNTTFCCILNIKSSPEFS